MKPLNLKPKEIDIIVSSLEQAIIFWDENISKNRLPKDFDINLAEKLYDDIVITYIKFSNLQEDMEKELEMEEVQLPNNVLRFPGNE
jgi:predicted HTH transcriptional regulator